MAYVITNSARFDSDKIDYLPLTENVRGQEITLQLYNKERHETGVWNMFQCAIEEGNSYPQWTTSWENFQAYYVAPSHDTFVATNQAGLVIGSFYVKPNYPDRCGHICNGGFLVAKEARGAGIGKFLGYHFLFIARDLGFKASIFNLVFHANHASYKLWESLGYAKIGTIPKVAQLKGADELVDATIFHFDFGRLVTESAYAQKDGKPCYTKTQFK